MNRLASLKLNALITVRFAGVEFFYSTQFSPNFSPSFQAINFFEGFAAVFTIKAIAKIYKDNWRLLFTQ